MSARYSLVVFAVVAAAMAAPALALDLQITGLNATRVVENISCGQQLGGIATQVTIKNDGLGGVLCWYADSDSLEQRKLTDRCIRPSDQPSFSFALKMPFEGFRQIDVQMECFDFYDLDDEKDICEDGFSYDYAVGNKYTCANADGKGCLGHVMPLITFNLSCPKVDFSLTAGRPARILYSNEKADILLNLTNRMNHTLACGPDFGPVGINKSVFKAMQIQAPAEGSGFFDATFSATCSWSGGSVASSVATVRIDYKEDPCLLQLNNARRNTTPAYSLIVDAKRNVGANGTQEKAANITLADYYYTLARSDLQSGERACNLGQKENASAYVMSALSKALASISHSGNALQPAVIDEGAGGMADGEVPELSEITNVTVIDGTAQISSSALMMQLGIVAAAIGIALAFYFSRPARRKRL